MLYGLRVLTLAQDRVSGECNFSPLSNCKQAFNYKLAVLTALGETKPHSVLKLNPEGSVFQKQSVYSCLQPSIFMRVLLMWLLIIKHQSFVLRFLKFDPWMQILIFVKLQSALSIMFECFLSVEG